MDTLQAMREMLDNAGMTPYAAGKAVGKSHTYVSGLFTRQTTPNANRLAIIADACGYDLVLQSRDTGKQIVIDGTTSD